MATTYTLAPLGYQTIFDANGDPISGGLVQTYLTGTTTASPTFSDTIGTQNANPIVADASGRFVAYLPTGISQKWVYQTAAGVTFRTIDPIAATPSTSINLDVTGTAGEALTAGQVVYLSDGSGSKTAGQWFLADADNPYSSTLPVIGMVPSDIASLASGTIRLAGKVDGLSGLSVGSTYYASATAGSTTSTAPTNARIVGVADTTTTLVLSPNTTPAQNTDLTLTAGEAITAGNVCYVSDGSGALTAGRIYKADGDLAYASSQAIIVGICPNAISSAASGVLRIAGRVTGLTGLTAGLTYYADTTAGALSNTRPANNRIIGIADSTTSLLLNTAGQVGQYQVLAAGSGTTTSASAENVASVATAALTANDRLEVYYTAETVTAATAAPVLYNLTDSLALGGIYNTGTGFAGDNMAAGTKVFGRALFQQFQIDATSVACMNHGFRATAAASSVGDDVTFTTNWTGAWSLAFRHGGVTATGTFRWSWLVCVRRGSAS